jgi:crotonobetainyl-CoA:carnitine CoA-transferase CaiB-like acyl-CoA transferase
MDAPPAGETANTRPGPLSGVRVLDASTILAAPMAATLLAEFGAEVIKIEQPGEGDPLRSFRPLRHGQSLHWRITNRNKRSLTLDLRRPRGHGLFCRLVRHADVVVVNFRPQTLQRLRLDYADLKAARDDVIMLHLSAFGRTGPYAERPGFARIAEAFAGLAYLTGYPDRPPVFAGYPIADGLAGIHGAFAIMLALRHRDRTGEGQLIDLALYEPLLRLMEDFVIAHGADGSVKERAGTAQPNIAPNNLYPTEDGGFVVIPASTEAIWRRLAALVDPALLERYPSNEERLRHRDAVDAAISGFTRSHPAETLVTLCAEAGIPCGKLNSARDIFADPQIAARGNLQRVFDPSLGEWLTMQSPIPHCSTIAPAPVSPGPAAPGEHSAEILRDLLGIETEEFDALRAEGVV